MTKYSARFSFIGLMIVVTGASVVRLYRLAEFPLGPFVDEIFTLNSSLVLTEKPFDPFGHILLFSEAWGKDHPNPFLYLNLLILRLFGVRYWTMKLLPVMAGVIACAAVFLIGRRIFEKRVALGTALLFAFAHWSIRLNRYGWDVSLMIMMFAVSIWLLVLAMQSGRPFYAFCSGIAAGLCLYSYLGARIAVLSLLGFLAMECALRRERWIYGQAVAFLAGAAAAAFPFFYYYFLNPAEFWARTSQVSVFNSPHPVLMILKNIVLHALMFLWMGGTFARDNFPGLPMMDPLTGFLLMAGLVILVRKMDTLGRLIGCAFLLNLATGVLSNSQEGAPYVYRTAAVIVPAFLTAGLGLQWLAEKIGTRWLIVWCAIIIGVNLYLYFGLEAHNIAAMRVMAYEPKVIGLEIARGHQPVWLVAPDVLAQTERSPRPGERYPNANPAVVLPPIIRRLAIIEFSGRYDTGRPVLDNLGHPQDIYFLEPAGLETNSSFIVRPSKIIFKSDNQKILETVTRLGASIRYVPNILGEPFLTVADF